MFAHLSKTLFAMSLSWIIATPVFAKDLIHTQDMDQSLYSALLMSLLQPNARIDKFDIFNPPPPDNSIQAQREWPAKAKAFQNNIWDRSLKFRKESFDIATSGKIKAGIYDVKRRIYSFCLPQIIFLNRVDRSHDAKRKPGLIKVQNNQTNSHEVCKGGRFKQSGNTITNGVKVSVPLDPIDAEFIYKKSLEAERLSSNVFCNKPENFYDEIHCYLHRWQVQDESTKNVIIEGQWVDNGTWKVTVGNKPNPNWALRSVNYN